MIDCVFSNFIDVDALFEKHGFKKTFPVKFRLGPDGKIYILPEPERCREGRERYSVIILEVDWDEEKIISSSCHDLGEFDSGYCHIQPIGENILMVYSRCCYNRGNPDKNATILNLDGRIINKYCFGDGIQDVYVRHDNTIVTSYFDEGIFGNYGWGYINGVQPIGEPGLIVWNEAGEQLFHAEHDMADCYAMNIDDQNRIWYYYYDDFKLVCLSDCGEKEFDPHIEGAEFFVLTDDGRKVIFDSGYDDRGAYEVFDLYKNDQNEKLRFLFKDDELLLYNHQSYGSKAGFVDEKNRMFIKRFKCV